MKNRALLRGLFITLAAFLVLFAMLMYGITHVSENSTGDLTQTLRSSVLQATLTCYAVEGRYPPNAAYLTQYYGLTYDASRYIVTLTSFAENLLPDIAVLVEGEV